MTSEFEEIFSKLAPSSEKGSVLNARATHRLLPAGIVLLAKTSAGFPCVVIGLSLSAPASFPTSVDLEYICVRHGLSAKIQGIDVPESQRFSVILLKSSDINLRAVFLRFIFAIASGWEDTPDAASLARELRDFIDLLRSLREPPRETIQGLWGELFLIAHSRSPSWWFDGWHTDPNEAQDFRFAEGFVEVKSWSGGLRCHRFSHRQLWPQGRQSCFIASLLVEPSASGVSVLMLAERIRAELGPEQCVRFDRIVLQTLGLDYQNADRLRFDEESASRSLTFYSVEAIPRLKEELPRGISEASYLVDLDVVPSSPLPGWLSWPIEGPSRFG